MAFTSPFFALSAPLVKNETVNGIIGNTHGVNNAISPPRNPKIKIPILDFFLTSSCWYFSFPLIFRFNSSDSCLLFSSRVVDVCLLTFSPDKDEFP
jgi:hypothetical protein